MTAGVIIETPPAGKRGSNSVVAEDWLPWPLPPDGAEVVAAAEPLFDLPEVVLVPEVEEV